MTVKNARGFSHIDTWIFDLDNTLYPASCRLFDQIDVKIGAFVSNLLGIDEVEARRIQKAYFYKYGTTLRGLMSEHQIVPDDFLDYVHDIDHSPVPANQASPSPPNPARSVQLPAPHSTRLPLPPEPPSTTFAFPPLTPSLRTPGPRRSRPRPHTHGVWAGSGAEIAGKPSPHAGSSGFG